MYTYAWRLLPITLLALIGSVVSAPVSAACSAGPCPLVWQDEFNGSTVDTGKWEFMLGDGCAYGICGWGNNELQYYRAENATVANGALTITAKQESFGGKQYTSARLRTLNLGDWTYGRFEMRAKLPVGQGMWPAFWMLPTNSPYGGWARSGEIDIMETVGNDPSRIHGTIHYHDQWPDNWQSGNSYVLPAGNPTDWHVYAIEWEPAEIRWYVDGVLYSTKTAWDAVGYPFPAPFDVDFHLLLNLAVGGDWPGAPDGSTVFPQQYVIDYVRVYALPQTSQVFDDMEHGNPFGNGYFEFFSPIGLGVTESTTADLPPVNGGVYALSTSLTGSGATGYLGGFGRTRPFEIAPDRTNFSLWINPDPGQDYRLEINLQEDDNGDGTADDEFQYNCDISPTGPCAVAGGGWQLVSIPLSGFFDDNSVLTGGNGVLDAVSTANGGNGELINLVMSVITNTTADVTFRSDYWAFLDDIDSDGIDAATDNCTLVANSNQLDADGDLHGNACDADLDNSCGSVNLADLVTFRQVFGTADATADLNGSGGSVNLGDLILFRQLFGLPPGPSAAGGLCP